VAFVDPGRGRGPADRLGLAVQLCTLPWLGLGPTMWVRRRRCREQTRTDHLRLAAEFLGWSTGPPDSVRKIAHTLHYAQQGTITRRHLAGQTEQAWCLTVLTNVVITWSEEYYSLAVNQLRAQGRDVPDELLAHISPAHPENIFGAITVDVEAELAKLDTGGWRPLRPAVPEPEPGAVTRLLPVDAPRYGRMTAEMVA
jgi:hypothetical protein